MRAKPHFRFTVIVILAAITIAGLALAKPWPQGSAPQTVHVGGNIKPPVKIKDVKPEYPPVALRERMQGVIILEVTIGTDGKVKDIKVIRSLPLLADAAVAAVRGWEYRPTMVDGKAVQVITTIPVNFALQ